MRTAIVSGSFDPITVGHLNLIARAEALFDRVVVLVGKNISKTDFLPDAVRLASVKACIREESVEVCLLDGLLAEYVQRYENPVIVRGARNGSDFDYEAQVAAMNRDIGNVETVILPAEGALAHISSTYARDLIRYGRSIQGVVPDAAAAVVLTYLAERK